MRENDREGCVWREGRGGGERQTERSVCVCVCAVEYVRESGRASVRLSIQNI